MLINHSAISTILFFSLKNKSARPNGHHRFLGLAESKEEWEKIFPV
ncbi:hypothetical protein B4135_0458 [Caldibacillus debilis]|uniref:Uncharacterized protein n=1 Tax=Caldibacillus debilis TaxID=301148 RepID=A0A150L9V1_9BACI|nr:hypothetical protein B4135_0458 [Caldibacillus debilis]